MPQLSSIKNLNKAEILKIKAFFCFVLLGLLFLFMAFYWSFNPIILWFIYGLWLVTFAFFWIVELRFKERPLKKALFAITYIVLQTPIHDVLNLHYMYDMAMIIEITDIPIVYGYLPHCLIQWFKTRSHKSEGRK